jgi:hypothetical protein
MPYDPRTSKPIESLTLADLAAFPIWEYDDEGVIEGRNETWVRPIDSRTVPGRSYTIVAADFRAACGRESQGFLHVSRLEDPAEFFNGVIHEGNGSYLIPNPDLIFFDRAMAKLLKGLGLSEPKLFPITFSLRVPFDGERECRGGILDGKQSDLDGRPDQA